MKSHLLYWLPALGLFLFTFALRLVGDYDLSIYLDEAASAFHGLLPQEDFQAFLSRDANPPLYYYLLRHWMSWFGYSELGIRSLSILFNSLTVSAVYLIGTRFFNFRVGLTAAALLLLSSFHQAYAYEARCFSMVGFLVTLSFGLFLLYWAHPKKWVLAAWTLANLAMLYTHFAAFPALVVQAALIPMWWDRGKPLLWPVLALGLTGLALLPAYWGITPDKMQATARWMEAPEWKQFWPLYRRLAGTEWYARFLIGISVLGLVFEWVKGRREQVRWLVTFMAWGWASLFIAFWMSQHTPFFLPKYLLYASIGMVLSFAAGLHAFLPKMGWALPLLLILFRTGPVTHPPVAKEDWKTAAAYALEQQQGGCILVTPVYQAKTFVYYTYPEMWLHGHQMLVEMLPYRIFGLNHLEPAFFDYQHCDRLVLVQSHFGFQDPKEKNLRLLRARYRLVSQRKFTAIRVTVFEQ